MTLVAEASAVLAARWGRPAPPGTVRIDHAERAVFDVVGPGGRAAVVKVDRSLSRHRRERAALDTLADTAVPVPAVLLADEGPPGVIVLERIEGRPLVRGRSNSGARARRTPPERRGPAPGEAWPAAGRVLRRLHEQPMAEDLEPFGGTGEAWLAHMQAWAQRERRLARTARTALGDGVVDRLCDRIEETLAATRIFPMVFLHGDAQPEHVLLRSQVQRSPEAVLIDFGDAGRGDPAWDLTVLTLFHPERLAEMLTAYQPDCDLARHLERLMPAYAGLRLLGAVTWMEEHGFNSDREGAALRRFTIGAAHGW